MQLAAKAGFYKRGFMQDQLFIIDNLLNPRAQQQALQQ